MVKELLRRIIHFFFGLRYVFDVPVEVVFGRGARHAFEYPVKISNAVEAAAVGYPRNIIETSAGEALTGFCNTKLV